ncbi:RNA polymerase sigma-70 factor [Hallella multisaccharivorax]|uniref:RNA polymerase sigma-70 factor n=1 Tax=Hallella multisaccharivorax TaxID=310514 RepID=UPI00361DF66B
MEKLTCSDTTCQGNSIIEDSIAFGSLYKKYYTDLCEYAHKFVGQSEADEIVQDLFMKLWEERGKLQIPTSLSAYLYRSVYLRCISSIEMVQTRLKYMKEYWFLLKIQGQGQDILTDELLIRIHHIVDKLPKTYREAFCSHYYYNNTYQEIAKTLHVSPKTIDYRLRQAMKQLRHELKNSCKSSSSMTL